MSEESEIQAEVEALRERFSDTKALYREVCALLFFRYGITPTASKLYQHVRKGSMSAPAEALAKFWEDLRGKARVEIDHPDLPEALKEAAGQAVSVLWTQATELARGELAVLRVEAHAEAQSAQADLQEALQRSAVLETQIQTAQTKVTELETRAQALAAELEQERRAHAASTARGEALSRQVDELKQEQSKSRQHFSAELEKGRAAIDEAAQRSTEAEHRALREIDRERTARAQAEKQLEQLRGKLTETERDCHAKLLEANAAQSFFKNISMFFRLKTYGQSLLFFSENTGGFGYTSQSIAFSCLWCLQGISPSWQHVCESKNELGPFLHHLTTLLQHVASPVSCFYLVADHVCQRHLSHFLGIVRRFRSPVTEGRAKAVYRQIIALHPAKHRRERHIRKRLMVPHTWEN